VAVHWEDHSPYWFPVLHWLLRNWVFVASNMLMPFEQWIYLDITNDVRERLDKQRIAPA
jgi:hypothetical protein